MGPRPPEVGRGTPIISKATCSCSTRAGRSCWKPRTSPPAPRTRCRPENEQEDLDDWLYEVRWEPKELEAPGPSPLDQRANWLVFADAGGVGQALQRYLEEHGEACVLVYPGDEYLEEGAGRYRLDPADPAHFRRLLADLTEAGSLPLRGVAYLWGLTADPPPETRIESLEEARYAGVHRRAAPGAGIDDVGRRAPPLAGDTRDPTRGGQTRVRRPGAALGPGKGHLPGTSGVRLHQGGPGLIGGGPIAVPGALGRRRGRPDRAARR